MFIIAAFSAVCHVAAFVILVRHLGRSRPIANCTLAEGKAKRRGC